VPPVMMNLDPNWIPMNWPCGPLEWARRSKAAHVAEQLKETLHAWAQPAALGLLEGTPVNCLIVPWAAGVTEDSAQQQALQQLVEAGRRRGLSFVGKIAGAGVAASAASARATGLSAVMLAEPAGQSLDLPVVVQCPRDKVAWPPASPIFCATDNDWPGLKLENMHGDTAVAGPTGVPWVNSNAWFSLLARELAPGKTLWLDFDPPDGTDVAHPADYALALADSAAYGSRWIISLDDQLRAALLQNNPRAAATWSSAVKILNFYERHRDWQAFRPQGVLAVVSDFRGDNAFLGGEVLNLLNRRQVQFLVMERSRAMAAPIPGLKAILWADKVAPDSDQLARLLAFVRRGGLLIAAAYWGPPGVVPRSSDPSLDYKLYSIGQGQIAVSAEGFQDPYQVAADAHLLVSRRNDLVRLYNPATTNCHLSFDPAHKMRLAQVLNYSSSPANYVTLWLNTRAAAARFWNPASPGSRSMAGVAAAPGTDFDLPEIGIACALEIEEQLASA
jgi:hypothetical protein